MNKIKPVDLIIQKYLQSDFIKEVNNHIISQNKQTLKIKTIPPNLFLFLSYCIFHKTKKNTILLTTCEQKEITYNHIFQISKDNTFILPECIISKDKNKYLENIIIRNKIVKKCLENPLFIIATPESIIEKLPSDSYIKKNSFKIKVGQSIYIDKLISDLKNIEFEKTDFLNYPGYFAIRGGIIDIFSFSTNHPARIELNDDMVESIRLFDVESQLSIQHINSIEISPQTKQNDKDIFDILPSDSLIISNEFNQIKSNETSKKIKSKIQLINEQKLNSEIINYNKYTQVIEDIENSKVNKFIKFNSSENSHNSININSYPNSSFNKNFKLLTQKLQDNQKNKIENYILLDNEAQLDRLNSIIHSIKENINFKPIIFNSNEGFIDNTNKIAIYTSHQIFDTYFKPKIIQNITKTQNTKLLKISQIKKGDYISHIDYGIGRFEGLKKIIKNDTEYELIKLSYLNDAIVYINIHSLYKISKHSIDNQEKPKLSQLGSKKWTNLKKSLKKKIKTLAFDLVKIYAKRKAKKGFAFFSDDYMQKEMEDTFPYQETPDQLKAIEEVKKDMESISPMDRLICGDAGFGKTEVAIRAAFKAVCSGKQVVILTPTTLLCFQHYKNFESRLSNFPCNVDYINRFRNLKERKKIIENIKEGKIDIIIATHLITSDNIKFKDLGLLIVDEEQKFGVNTKEKLKKMKETIDTLTLSATPIPRTLKFSFLGIRDMSIISSPPKERQAISTQIIKFDRPIIKNIIEYELSRGGQVFFLHNKIENIHQMSEIIQKIVPKAKIVISHAKINSKKLENNMLSFINGEFDILLATSIIENGLDIPNSNTIIINDAHKFGLSDLYQIRGRVGRSNRKGYCYLICPSLETLNPKISKRLEAIQQFNELGSGIHIAMKDLEIRGAGQLMGAEQSGFIENMGFDTYQKILQDAVEELKYDELSKIPNLDNIKTRSECEMSFDYDVYIPNYYVEDTDLRFSLYQELNKVTNPKDLNQFEEKLKDKFGKMPPPVLNLIESIRIKFIATELHINKISFKNNQMNISIIENNNLSSENFNKIMLLVKNNPSSTSLKQSINSKDQNTISIKVNNLKSIFDIRKMLRELV